MAPSPNVEKPKILNKVKIQILFKKTVLKVRVFKVKRKKVMVYFSQFSKVEKRQNRKVADVSEKKLNSQ